VVEIGSRISTVDIREPIITTLGLPICAQSMPWAEGTTGYFIAEGGNTKRLLLVTAHPALPDKNEYNSFECKDNSQRRHNVTLFGDTSF
jgi:hypothetical protein